MKPAYLRDELSAALLKHGWSVGGGFFNKEKHDWVGTTDIDTRIRAGTDSLVLKIEQLRLSRAQRSCGFL